MDGTEDRVAALCAAPVGCLVLLTVEASGLSATEAARPEIALQVAAWTDRVANPWHGNHAEVLKRALKHGPRLVSLATEIVAQEEADWWWAPLDRDAQLWTGASSERGAALDGPGDLVPKTGPPSDFERYALRPDRGLLTSTAHGEVTAHLAYLAWGTGDFPDEHPTPRRRYVVSPAARVFEVHGPQDWHALAAAYPAAQQGPARNAVPGDRPDQVVPDWAAIAREWDGVHLSFGGMLTTRFVWSEGRSGPTRNWTWEIEGTEWLRWAFDAIDDDPPIARIPPENDRIAAATPKWIDWFE